ncbi:MAG TPA: hypothetical protein PK777_00575 [Thermoguttaceae bacterium]|nr:hypothetical protein [Thermoguttaceae bacterium]HPP51413.1 hypothetical protein [Thermoguttaceae bacterium]
MPAQPHITIRLEGGSRSFSPGSLLRGEYWLEGVSSEEVKAVELSILWYTEGKGEEDLAVHFFRRDSLDQLPYAAGRWIGAFSTVLPHSPLSYQGLIVKIVWCVRVRVFLARGKQVLEELRFRLGSAWVPKGISK